ncbi:hypothetical protein [Prosthecobacter sp.]|jgi:hypothetical protein|uniref:hypothetical protein n=1 Tax=Prosthecobacter sp. TaxID=1965333 RepID=UPI0037CC4D7E
MKKKSKAEWATGLQEHLSVRQKDEPIPERENLTPMQEQQCRILGGHLIRWLQQWGPALIQERNFFADLNKWDKQPVIVILTDVPGLVAASEILGPPNDSLIYGKRQHVREYLTTTPDAEFTFHCELASYFEELDEAKATTLRERFNLDDQTLLASHFDCSIMGPLFARGGRHLWSFQEETPSLVEEGYESWVS